MPNQYLNVLNDLPHLDQIPYRFSAVSLFTGGGGLDLGLAFAGFEPAFATDLHQEHCDTIALNFPKATTLSVDATLLTGAQIRAGTGRQDFDLLAGGPPCQAFSILGQRNSFKDPRGRLVYEYVRLVNELQPAAFLFENVPGLLTLHSGKDWMELLDYFRHETGYQVIHQVLNAADYGVPQIRRRVIVIGFRSHNITFKFPERAHQDPSEQASLIEPSLSPWLPARLALEDVDGLPNHRLRPHGQRVTERYSRIAPGSRDKVDHTDRVHPDRPAGTVLVGSKAGGGRPFIHPYEPRHLTVREAARLQSFPDWYVFAATETWQYRSVGNAVPPLLAKAIGTQIAKSLDSP